jgi:RimJ/RimL family protein N-acetyltransferase
VSGIILRDAAIDDELLVFKWRNIDALIALSSKRKKVTLQEHSHWFRRKILDLNCKLLIIQLEDKNIGLIRLESRQGECGITIYLIPGYDGQGFGYTALSQAIDNCTLDCKSYFAEVQIRNIPSQKLFQKLGFSKASEDDNLILYNKNHIST